MMGSITAAICKNFGSFRYLGWLKRMEGCQKRVKRERGGMRREGRG